MPKPRRKSDIRACALRQAAALREAAAQRAAFLQPRARSWHDVFLAALRSGQSVSAAAAAAGVSKSGVYQARLNAPGFRAAWNAALAVARFNDEGPRFNAIAASPARCELGPPEVDSFPAQSAPSPHADSVTRV